MEGLAADKQHGQMDCGLYREQGKLSLSQYTKTAHRDMMKENRWNITATGLRWPDLLVTLHQQLFRISDGVFLRTIPQVMTYIHSEWSSLFFVFAPKWKIEKRYPSWKEKHLNHFNIKNAICIVRTNSYAKQKERHHKKALKSTD